MTAANPDTAGPDALRSLRGLLQSDRDAVVATVVDVEGNAYRRPGAKMLVDADGTTSGHVTAGCLEDELASLAADVLDADEPRLETYDLTGDAADVWGLGIGCNGVVDVLIEPLDDSFDPLVDAVEDAAPIGAVTALDGETADGTAIPLGARAYYRDGDVTAVGDRVPGWLIDAIHEPAAELVAEDGTDTLTIDVESGTATVFVDGIQPAPRLAVLGSGHDVGPVIELGTKHGFRVTVVGFRGAVDLEGRFPAADEYVSTSPATVAEAIGADERTYAVVMTHNFVDDRLAVESLLDADADVPYVGLMGPRERFEKLLEDAEADGTSFDDGQLETIYAPIGLDLGAGSPYGIATSIVAEVLAVHNDREPIHLSEREGPIHDRIDVEVPGGE